MKKYFYTFSTILLIVAQSSCVSFKPGYENSSKPESEITNITLARIIEMESEADTKEEIKALIDAYLSISNQDDYHYHGLWKAGNYNILMGAAYCDSKSEKKKYYKEAIKLCEAAMGTNSDFMNQITQGKDLIDASEKLTINEIDAMGYWYTARFYYFKECLAPMGRVMNTKIVVENNRMIELIDLLDANWAGGGNYFSRGLYYIAVPERFGGSKAIAEDEFNKAVEVGPNYIVNRWGRAKYLYQLTGDNEGYKKDLVWVIAQDPHKCGNTYPWNVYFQNDAKTLLSSISQAHNITKQ